MNATGEQTMEWHNDGHSLWLQIEKSELKILQTKCPENEDAKCGWDEPHGCLVTRFINLYGFECNIGTCHPEEHLEICWSFVGDRYLPDEGQVWFVPVNDAVFYAWMKTRT